MADLYKQQVGQPMSLYKDHRFGGDIRSREDLLKKSTTLYVGNLSFYTTEEQIFDLFSKVGEIKRIIMGLDRFKKTPCGFCFVEYYRRVDAEKSVKFISNTKLDERTIRVDYDTGFADGRQYGRGRSGGQVRDEHRMDYDPGRGGFGKAMAPQTGMSGMDMWGNSKFQNGGDGYNSGSFRRGSFRGRGRGRRPYRGRPNFRDRGGYGHGPGGPPPFMEGGKRRRTDDFDHDSNFQKRQRITGYPNMPMHANGHPRFGPPPHAMPPHNGNHMMQDGPMPPQRAMPHGPVPPHRPGPPQAEPARNEKFDRGRKDDE